MDPSLANLSHQVFGPGSRTVEGRVRSQAEGIIERLTIYHWPKGIKDDDRLAFLSMFAAYGRSDDESPSAWATWAFSYLVLAFPEFQTAISNVNSREYHFEPLSATYIQALVNLSHRAQDFSDSQPEEYGKYTNDVHSPIRLPHLTSNLDSFSPDFAASATVPAVYGYCSLLLFLAGKRITEKNVSSISEKRPSNLVNAFSINEYSAYILAGEGKMQSTAHSNVNQAWNTYAGARIAMITEVAAFASGATLPQRVVYTITKLLEYSGMQPAYYIHRFLQAMPEAASYSCVRPSLNAYISSVREVASAPSYLQPYYKLIHGDGTRAFHRNTILLLSSCAVTYEKNTSASMVNFVLGEGASAAVNIFDAEAVRKNGQTLSGLTFRDENDDEAD